MSKQSPASFAHDRLTLRGFRNRSDFEIIAQIRNDTARRQDGDRMTPIDAKVMESLVSTPERLRIAQVDQNPVGFVFVAGAGGPQLDEFGTIEGKSWLFIGPTCTPEWQREGIEGELLAWLVAYAREMGIARLIKFARTGSAHEYINEILAEAGFRERLRYYLMRLEMTAPPPPPRELSDEFELVDFGGEKDFHILWSILEPAFSYLERDSNSYEQNKAIFGSMRSAYFPICIESASGRPVGTIAMVPSRDRGHVATLGVIPSFQRRGIGSLLMERAIDHAWQLGVRTIDLSVRVENPQAIAIYSRFGFQTIPEQTTMVLLRDI
jgi:ribosomal protein S18 acetylase RimI-like enzyme